MKISYIFMALLLVGVVNALSITSPEDATYNTDTVLVVAEHSETLDSIDYVLNDEDFDGCTDCSLLNITLDLDNGDYVLSVEGILDNETFTDEVEFVVDVDPVFGINIIGLENKTYDTNIVPLSIKASSQLDKIDYEIDGSGATACNDCTEFNRTLNLTVGQHTIKVFGFVDDTVESDEVSFDILLPQPVPGFSINIVSPQAKTYDNETINIIVESNITVDEIFVELNDDNWTCTNCSMLNDTLTLDEGDYTLTAKGYLDDVMKTVYVDFKVLLKVNETPDDNETDYDNETDDDYNNTYDGEPRFTTGFEKLPQMVADGQLSDAELADILRDNNINPGIINRLIKTGMLGNESLNVILDTQQPPGIFKKLWSAIGFKVTTHASLIAETYSLDDTTVKKIIAKEILPRVKERIMNEIKIADNKVPPGLAKKAEVRTNAVNDDSDDESDNNSNVPPGLAKKNNDKVPPGQAKKNN